MDRADQIANGDRPMVQESEQFENCVEIVFPAENRVVVLDEETAMTMFAEMMRVVTGEALDW